MAINLGLHYQFEKMDADYLIHMEEVIENLNEDFIFSIKLDEQT